MTDPVQKTDIENLVDAVAEAKRRDDVRIVKQTNVRVGRNTVEQHLNDFYLQYASVEPYKVPLEKIQNSKAQKEFERFLMMVMAGEDPADDTKKNPTGTFSYGSFYLEEPKQIDGRKANLMWLWQQYLEGLPQDKKNENFVRAAAQYSNQFDPKKHRSKFEVGDDFMAKAHVKPSPFVPPTPILPHVPPIASAPPIPPTPPISVKVAYRASIGLSSVSAFMASAAIPVGVMLFSTGSRLAICGVIAMAAPVWVMPVIGAGIGITIGTTTSAIRNHKAIGADMDKVSGGWNKTKALIVGIGKSMSFMQVAFNIASGAIGMGALGALANYICDVTPDAVDALTREVSELKTQLGSVTETMQGQQGLISSQTQTITDLKDTVTNLNETIEDLNENVGTLTDHVMGLEDNVEGLEARMTELELKAEAPEEIPAPEPEPEIIPEKEPEGIPTPEPEPEIIPEKEPEGIPKPEPEPEIPAEEPEEIPVEGVINLFSVTPSFETVAAGDNLWTIAAHQLGISPTDVAQTVNIQDYVEGIIAANQNDMPELANNPNVIDIGDHLNMPTAETVPADCNWVKVDAGQSGACRFPALKAA